MQAETKANKALVLDFTKRILQERDLEKLDGFVADDIDQHAAPIGAGRRGMAEWLTSKEAGAYETLFQLIGQGDFALTYGKRHAIGKNIAVFNAYRVSDGKIAEH